MKIHPASVLTVPVLLALTLAPPALATEPTKIVRHDIRVRIDPEKGVLEGDCTVTVDVGEGHEPDLTFDMPDGRVLSVEWDGKKTERFRAVRIPGISERHGVSWIVVPVHFLSAGTHRLRVRYEDRSFYGTATSPEDGKPFTLGQIDPARGSFSSHIPWYPHIEREGSGADIRLTAPSELVAVSSGELVSRDDVEGKWTTWHWRSEHGSGLLPYPFAVHRYGILHDPGDESIPLAAYYLPGDEQFARQRLPVMRQIFEWCAKAFGAYPFPRLTVVETDLREGHIGLAAQSVVMLSKNTWFGCDLDPENLRFENHAMAVLVDEIAHQWNAYKVAAPNFLAEGISRYVSSLYAGDRGGEQELRAQMRITRAQYAALAAQVPRLALTDPEVTPALYFIKGALALDLLRTRLGPETFLSGLRRFFARGPDVDSGLDAFSAAFEAVSGQDLDWFFEQWWRRGGHPQLTADYEDLGPAEPRGRRVRITVEQTQRGPPYRCLLDLRFRGGGDREPHRMRRDIRARREEFEMTLPFRPVAMDADPDRRLPADWR